MDRRRKDKHAPGPWRRRRPWTGPCAWRRAHVGRRACLLGVFSRCLGGKDPSMGKLCGVSVSTECAERMARCVHGRHLLHPCAEIVERMRRRLMPVGAHGREAWTVKSQAVNVAIEGGPDRHGARVDGGGGRCRRGPQRRDGRRTATGRERGAGSRGGSAMDVVAVLSRVAF